MSEKTKNKGKKGGWMRGGEGCDEMKEMKKNCYYYFCDLFFPFKRSARSTFLLFCILAGQLLVP